MVFLSEECKALEKRAKTREKGDLVAAIDLYKQAADCYKNNNKAKNSMSCLDKVGRLLREKARLKEDPSEALEIFQFSAETFEEIGNKSEAEKVLNEAYKNFIDVAKNLRANALKMTDINAAEEKFTIASENAKKGKEEQLSNSCWIDSAEQFRKAAIGTESPRDALELFKHAVQNFVKGGYRDGIFKSLSEAADKFNKKGIAIEKTKKDLILAIDKFVQAQRLYQSAKNEEKASSLDVKVKGLCEFIGLPLEHIMSYLESIGIMKISV